MGDIIPLKQNKKVAMVTTFFGYLESYSLCQVARQQFRMLKQNGYDARLVYRGGGGWEPVVTDVKEIPDFICDNDGNSKGMEERAKKTFDEMVMETAQALEAALEGVEVIITHDLIYQSSNNIQDAACAIFAEKHPDILWLHWIHSATSPRDLNKSIRGKYRNSFICYPNSYDVPRVADNFGYETDEVKVVPHPMDYVEFFDMHPLTEKLIKEKDLLSADVICIYPLRLDRGKQPEFSLRIMNQMKGFRRSIRFVVIDFHSTGGDKVTYRNEMKALAKSFGWNDHEITFMSEFDKSCELETPKKVVRDLFILSNCYIHPSKSETYSFVCQEARACKNMLVLNFDFPAMASIYGQGPIYKKFSSCVDMMQGRDGETTTRYNEGVDHYMREVAGNLLYHLNHQSVLAMSTETRQNKNLQTIFKRHIEPLFYASKVQ